MRHERIMVLTTKTKVALAAIAYRAIATVRVIAGMGDFANVSRGGIKWSLDLSEGIDFSIYLLGAFERSTRATLQKLIKPGDIVFDIGANIGAHTLGLAQSAGPDGKVYAFEPTDLAFEKLKQNLALNPELSKRTDARQILLADDPSAPRETEIYASWPLGAADDFVHPKHRGQLVTTLRARVDTVDRFVERESIERLNLMKIDVDGHEYSVLRGAVKTVEKFQPVLVMEMCPYVHDEKGHGFDALVGILRDAGYSLQDASTWKPLPIRTDELEALIPDGASINVIARAK
jgi:FkbM family methyltransferase